MRSIAILIKIYDLHIKYSNLIENIIIRMQRSKFLCVSFICTKSVNINLSYVRRNNLIAHIV